MDVQKSFEELRERGLPIGGGWIAAAVAGAAVLLLIYTSLFQIAADSVGIVLRFGKPVREVGPGLHVKAPFGIEEVRRVPTQRQQKVEFGYRTDRPGVTTEYSDRNFALESLMLTGDLNVVDVEWAVQYRIADAEKYLFEVRNTRETFRFMSQAVMREIVGDRTVNEVLTVGRAEVARSVKSQLQDLCDDYEIGLRVEQVNLQDITPPDPVKPSFNEVNEAQQQRSQLINEAKADYNKAIPNARGEAKRTVQQAEGYAVDRVNRARGEVARFENVLEEFRKSPAVTKRRLYIETMSDVLPKVDRKYVLDSDATDVLPILPFDRSGAPLASTTDSSGSQK